MAEELLDFPHILSHVIEEDRSRGVAQPVRSDLPHPERSAPRSQRKRWWLVAVRDRPLQRGKTDAGRRQSSGTALCCYSQLRPILSLSPATGKALTSKPHPPQTGMPQPLSNSDSSFLLTTMSTRRFFSSNIHVAEVSAISGSGISNVSVRGLVRYWPKSTRIVFTSMWESPGEGTSFTSIADALSGEVNFSFRRTTTFANGSPKGVNSSSFWRIAARCSPGLMAGFSSSP